MLKSARQKCEVTNNSKPITLIADFSVETLKARRR
jgi:hypothetical protein